MSIVENISHSCTPFWDSSAMADPSFRSRGWAREENTYRWRAGPASLEWARDGEQSIPRGPSSTVTHSELKNFCPSES